MRIQALRQVMVTSVLLVAVGGAVLVQLDSLPVPVPAINMTLIALGLWLPVVFLVWRGLDWHPHEKFGPANMITLHRSAGTVLIAGLIPVAPLLSVPQLWLVTGLGIVLLSLDAIDGYLARRTRLASDFGARFDMEIDALLILVISVFVWRSGETGLWIITLGLMRYGFVLASIWLTPLRNTLFPSVRRKLVCVIQLVALCAILSPLLSKPVSSVAGVIALVCLTVSFAGDIVWLYRRQSFDEDSTAHDAPGTVAAMDTSP